MPTLLIVYNTKTGNTELMAKAVEEGAKQAKGVNVTRTYHATPSQLKEADAIAIGAPTYNHRMTLDIQQLLEKTAKTEVNLEGKTAAAFGSYGWSGEAPENVLEVLRNRFKMNTIEPPIRSKYRPREKTLEECRELGRKIAEKL